MSTSTKLKKRFCKDNNISITIFRSPYFESRLELLGKTQEYKDFIAEMQSIVKTKSHSVVAFNYSVKDMDAFSKEIRDSKNKYLSQHAFLKKIEVPKLLSAIEQCSSEQIDNLRRSIGTVYSFSNISEFFLDDKSSILQLKEGLMTLLSDEQNIRDKVIKLQLSWFIDNLDNILQKLN